MEPSDEPHLDESWVANTNDDSDVSWARETDDSDIDIATKSYFSKRISRPSPRNIRISRKVSLGKSSDDNGPELLMPSYESISPLKAGHKTQRSTKVPRQVTGQRDRRATGTNFYSTQSSHTEPRAHHTDYPLIFKQIGEYVLEIFASTLKKLKQPISWALAAYLFAGMLILIQNFLTTSISNAISPVCRIPGMSYLNLPICKFTARYPSTTADDTTPTIDASAQSTRGKRRKKSKQSEDGDNPTPEFDNLMQIQSRFSSLIDSSSSPAALTLPLDMKRSETSIRDLKQIVRFSSLSSKHELVHEFDGFIETARIASYDLQKFNSHVGRAVDNVLSTTRWTSRALADIADERDNRGLIPSFVQDRLLAPFQPLRFNEGKVLEQYIVHSRVVSDEIARLIDEATSLLTTLSNLEDRLDVIHGISLRDGLAARANRDEVLSHLWTFLGGNRDKLGKVDKQLRLLGRVAEYRQLAYAHVSTTVVKLQAMGAELEELRSRVGAVEVLKDSGRAVPLDVHLEAIRLGVERLEGQREKAREVERGHARRVSESGTPDETPRLVEAA